MMIEFSPRLPDKCFVAVSGGPDSMAALDFLQRDPSRDVAAIFFHHGTKASSRGFKVIKDYTDDEGIDLCVGAGMVDSDSSEEEFRNARYDYFKHFLDADPNDNAPIITAHHLDDQVETWLFYSMRGNPKLIPYKREDMNLIRPFLLTRKSGFVEWCERNNVPYIIDKTNLDPKANTRAYIRNVMLPNALEVNPGIHKTIKKKVQSNLEQYK